MGAPRRLRGPRGGDGRCRGHPHDKGRRWLVDGPRPAPRHRLRLHGRRRGPLARPALRSSARRRPRPVAGLRHVTLFMERRRMVRHRRPGQGVLRAPRGRVHAAGHARRRRGSAAGAAVGRRGRGRAHAGGSVPRAPRLGLRRRVAVRGARGLRWSRGAATVRRRRAPRRTRGVPRRGLQPPGSRWQLPVEVRPLLHRCPPHPVGLGGEPRPARRRRHAPLHLRQRAALVRGLPRRLPSPRRGP